MRNLSAFLTVLAVAVLPSLSHSQDVTGTFAAKGKATPLGYAYAFWKDQAPFAARLDLYVLLSDVPLAADVLPKNDRANSKIAELVRNDRIHAFELHFADPGKTLDSGEEAAVYHNAIAPARHGLNGFLHFQSLKFDGQALEGKVWMDQDTAQSAGFKIDAAFKVKTPAKQ
jgi:hypothetical protein